MTGAYYNEHDPFAAAWLRELISAGLIPDGEVDQRSITEVTADDVRPYRQAHFFAGIGGWPLALRLAGWPDDRPVWTGSPPCQPFSNAGRRRGAEDERHLAPVWLDLVRECRPERIFGEQVASKPVVGPSKPARRLPAEAPAWSWWDDLCARMEDAGYACGASDLPAAGVGAPHIRQRLFFGAVRVGHACVEGLQGHARDGDGGEEPGRVGAVPAGPASTAGDAGRLADADQGERRRRAEADRGHQRDGAPAGRIEGERDPAGGGDDGGVGDADRGGEATISGALGGPGAASSRGGAGGVADADCERREGLSLHLRERGPLEGVSQAAGGGGVGGVADAEDVGHERVRGARRRGHGLEDRGDGASERCARPGAAHGGWAPADWLRCRDGRWRPVEPAVLRLADGIPGGVVRGGAESSAAHPLAAAAGARTGRLRGYGNAIVPQLAAEFVAAFQEAMA